MTRFKDLFSETAHLGVLEGAAVSLRESQSPHTLYLKISSKDVITAATYAGPASAWMESLCELVEDLTIEKASALTQKSWEEKYHDDESFWEMIQDHQEDVFFKPLELLKASINHFRGFDFLYEPTSPLICRCFGIRENDLKGYQDLEALMSKTKAGMGCRTCLPQLKAHFTKADEKADRYYQGKPRADWLLDIDYLLSCFPEAQDWKMEVKSFQKNVVVIEYQKEVSQKEEEAVASKLQDFLGRGVDLGLSFFLRRSRHLSKA